MAIGVRITILDEGQLDSRILYRLLNRVENAARNSVTIVAIRLGNDLDLPEGVIQLLAIRISAHPESLFWINEIRAGSKVLLGSIFATTLLTTVFNNTIGESIKEGWQQTEAHTMISSSIPKIEKMLISEFRRLFDRPKGMPIDSGVDVDPIAVLREGETSTLDITVRQSRSKPRF